MNARYPVFLLIALCSGAAALSHELLWTRRLIDILGASGEATSLVLGCFFLGLSLGGAIAARRVARVANAWKSLATLEFAIALLTIPAAILPYWTEWIWPVLGPDALTSWPGRCVKLLISGLVVVPPATAMGMTLPILIAAIGRTVSDSPRTNVMVYAFNTLGGALGLLVTSVWLLELFGVFGCMLLAMTTNAVVGAVAWALSGRLQNVAPRVKRSKRSKNRRRHDTIADPLPRRWLLAMAWYSGFAVLALEIGVIRLLSLVVPSSFQATSSVLLTVILFLGVAALVVPGVIRLVPRPRLLLVAFIAFAAAATALSPVLLFHRTKKLIDVPHLAAIDGRTFSGALDFHLDVLSLSMTTVGPAILLAAAVFPALLAACAVNEGADAIAHHWASLLAINGIGGLMGTVVTEHLVIPNFGIYGGLVVVGAFQALAACGAAAALSGRRLLLVPGAFALVCCILLSQRVAKLHYISPNSTKKYQVDDTRFGKDGVCLVVTTERQGRGMLLNNQYLLGSTTAFDDQRRQVLIPLLLHSPPEPPGNEHPPNAIRVCCLGLATGISAGAALDYDERCHVTAVELARTVVGAAKQHFAKANRGVVDSPRASVIVEDARTYMAAVRDTYDVIAGDLYRPYGSGEGRLYSVEHFCNVRLALRKEGIYCQWIPAYQVTEQHFDIIAATFLQVFPNAVLLCADSESSNPKLGLLGTKDATIDWDQIAIRCRALATHGVVDDQALQDADFVESLYVGKLSEQQFENVPINTLNNVRLEIAAGLHRATRDPRNAKGRIDKESYLSGENWKTFLLRLRTANRQNPN